MSFLNNTLENAKKLYSAIEGKTIINVEAQKLKIKAIRVDNELAKLYERLGALYCKELRKREDLPDELALLLGNVDSKRAELAELKEQITAFEGGVACGECGNLNAENLDFCSKCGAEL